MHRKRDPVAIKPDIVSVRLDVGMEVFFFDGTSKNEELKVLVVWRIFVIQIAENNILREMVIFNVLRVAGDGSYLAVFVIAYFLN